VARAITRLDTKKSSVPENEAWFSLRLCRQPPVAAAATARTPDRPADVTKARAFAGRDFGAAAVME
jgi:hypothetical protein